MNDYQKPIKLLPNSFKKVGFGLLLLSILIVVLKANGVISGNKDMMFSITQSSILLGLLILAISKDKEEDELTIRLRLQAFTFAFTSGVMYIVVTPFVTFILPFDYDTSSEVPILSVFIMMFIFYFFTFYVAKATR